MSRSGYVTLANAYCALAEVEKRERHMLLVIELVDRARDRAEAARLLRIANEIRQEAREIVDGAMLALSAGH